MRLLCLFTSLLTLLQGCVLYPPYHRPDMEVPMDWRFKLEEAECYCNLRWWEKFDDKALDALIMEALENNNDLQVAIVRVTQYIGQLDIARSYLYPQIFGNGFAAHQEISTALTPVPTGFPRTYKQYDAFFTASYELDIWGKIRSGTDAAYANLIASIEARKTVVLTLVAAVADSYFNLRLYDKQLDISRRTYDAWEKAYQLAVVRYEGGVTSELEAKQAEAEKEIAAARVVDFEMLVAFQENLLSVLIGHPPQAIERGRWLDDMPMPPCIPVDLPSQVINQRPDILEAEYQLIAANANIGVARAEFFPDITLTGFYGNTSAHLDNLFTGPARAWQYAGGLLQPIFTGGRLLGQLEVAESKKWQAYYAYQQTVLNAFKEVNDALVAHKKTKELMEVQARRIDSLQQALKLATLQYNNGQVEYLNVLDAERSLFAAQLDYAFALGGTFTTLVDLYKALGGGWVEDVDSIALLFASPDECKE